MKRILLFCAMILLVCSSSCAFALASVKNLKIGIVDMQKLINQDPAVKVWKRKINTSFQAKNKIILAVRKRLVSDMGKLEKLSETNVVMRKKLKTRITENARQLRALQVELKAALVQKEKVALQDIMRKIQLAIDKVAMKKKIDLVVRSSSILFRGKSLNGSDITPEVRKNLHG